jgi:BASS family bile acid:Na+ symporter
MIAVSICLGFLARHATKFLAIGVLTGLFLPPLAEIMRPALAPAIFINLVLALIRLDFGDVAGFLRRPVLLLLFTGFALFLSPILMAGTVWAMGLPAGLAAGLILMAASAPITTAATFALILGLDAAFAIAATVICHLLLPFTLPAMALWLLNLELQISLVEFMGRLALMIGGSFALAIVVKRWLLSPARLQYHASHIDGLLVVGLMVVAIAIMDGVTDFFFARPDFVLLTIAAAFIANASLQILGAVAFLPAGRKLAFTAGHMAGNCNMALILAVLADRAEMEVVIFFALAQLPMYMLPVVANRIYRRLL